MIPAALAFGAFLVAPPSLPFAEERRLLDGRLETLRRILPDGPPSAGSDAAVAAQYAREARLTGIQTATAEPEEAGGRGVSLVQVAASGQYEEIERFFRAVAASPRLIDVRSLELTAGPEAVIRLAASLAFHFRPTRAPLPAPPEGLRARTKGVPRPQADAYLRDQAIALAKSQTIASLRRARRDPRLFLSELAAIVRDRPVVLNHASFGEEFVVRGLAVGEGPVRALQARFERGFFRVDEFLMMRQAACHRFEVRGRCPVVGPEAELPLPTEDPFRQDDAPCRVDRDEPRSVDVKGPSTKNGGKGPLSVRLRDVDLADVFLALHHLTGAAFVVGADVVGRANVELSRVSLDEALAAVEKAGLVVSREGGVFRVAARRSLPPPPGTPVGPPSDPLATGSFSLKRAEVRELLAVMAEADPGFASLGPAGSLGRVSVWARASPLGDVRAAVLRASGLSEAQEEGRRVLSRIAGADEAALPVAGDVPDRRLAVRPQDLAVSEFSLAGLASDGSRWIALAYAPTGALNVYRPGDRLADGSVRSADSTDIVLDTEDGPVRLPLAAGPR
jgi:hypothetical protein